MRFALLVDDSKTILMSLSRVLTGAGYKVETASDGDEALAKITGGMKPNVIITDLNMPRMDGLTFIRAVRKAPGGRFTPIFMLTTESQQAKRTEARAAGATGWLVKPIQPADLLQVLDKVIPKG
ncbi:MAG: response regulator [Solirubrobacteraceae bacterium]|jgi:two-component system chemotaxis response regulator CheY